MTCLILGGAGQLGQALQASAPAGQEIAALSHAACDITNAEQLREQLDALRPSLVINAAGYTDVNGAESHQDQAFRVNAEGAGRLAALCRAGRARLIHISTDFVFDGAATTPYAEDAAVNPLNAYGRSKAEGEKLVRREHPGSVIVRTSWLYAEQGNNFANTMLRLMGERDEIRVVADQTGTPTYTGNLARILWRLTDAEPGIYHATDEGETSWHGFALAIRDEASGLGLLKRKPEVVAIATSDFPTPARRPPYSVLGKSKLHALLGPGQHWRAALKDMLAAKKT